MAILFSITVLQADIGGTSQLAVGLLCAKEKKPISGSISLSSAQRITEISANVMGELGTYSVIQ